MSLKTSLICTTLNEENTIENLLISIKKLSTKPTEVIIVDGESKDKTVEIINKFIQKNKDLNIKLYIKKGNRSIGRNYAISKSSNAIILLTDAGCTLDKKWVKQISLPFKSNSVDVVAGYYKGEAKNAFEQALIPYVLVMEDRINQDEFLPATRSMAIKKEIWRKLGKFDESLSNNEDYEFAKRLKKKGVKVKFAKDALVYWKPRKDLLQAFNMFYRFALGDAESAILRPKVLLIFARYAFGILILFIFPILFLILLILYSIWSIFKNAKYVKEYSAYFYLLLLQFTSDIAVMFGTVEGVLKLLV